MNWLENAKCKKMDTSIFFPNTSEQSQRARDICKDCSVRLECLKYAMDNDIVYGVWGGLGEQGRRSLRTNRIPLDELV